MLIASQGLGGQLLPTVGLGSSPALGRRHDPGGWGGVEWVREPSRKPQEPFKEIPQEDLKDVHRENDIVLMKFALHFLQADKRSDDEHMVLSAMEFLRR